jgi:hypothetical protein
MTPEIAPAVLPGGRSKLASWNIGWLSKLVVSSASPAWSL